MVGERLGRFAARIADGVEDVVELVDDTIDNFEKPIILDIKGMKRAGGDCARTARETSELCETTVSKARQMVDFGMDIKSTLENLSGGIQADTFATIQDLIDGDKMKAAWALATEMDDLALSCVDQSCKMIDSIEGGIETLPDIFEGRIDQRMEQANAEGSRDGDPQLRNIEPDIEEIETTIKSIDEVNLFTVMKSGREAFQSLTSKGELCYDLFGTIQDFAKDVVEVGEAIQNFRLGAMIGKIRDLVKDIWRCLRLSDLIKSFAQAVGKLIKWILSLFTSISEKLATIWSSLAHAKDCLQDVIEHVLDSMNLCDTAKDKSIKLVDTCSEVQGHLVNITRINHESIKSITDLADGDEILLMIDLATNMDDIILECIKKVIEMIQKVSEGFDNLPDVIKEGIPDDAGNNDDDPEPANVQQDVEELCKSCGDIEEATALEAVTTSSDGFTNIQGKITKCQDMIVSSHNFADNCNKTIDSFMGIWDIESAMEHLIEMKRLVRLGEMMKQFANEIRTLVKATIDVMKAVMDKIKNIDLVPDQIEDTIEAIGDSLKESGIDGHRLKAVGIDGHRIKNFGKKLGNFF